jgi:ribosome maturation factor RimP
MPACLMWIQVSRSADRSGDVTARYALPNHRATSARARGSLTRVIQESCGTRQQAATKGVREMAPRSREDGRTPATRRPKAPAPSKRDARDQARAVAPRPPGPSPRQREAIRAVVAPVVAAAGYDLEELTVSRAGRRYLVRLIVDTDGGVSLDAIAEISRAVSAALDGAEAAGGELVAGEYQLEVSSPGVDRPLTQPRHWRRNRGRLVKVAVGGRQVTARVLDADETGVTLDLEPAARHLPYPELGTGRVQVEFSRLDEAVDEDETDDENETDDEDEAGEAYGVAGEDRPLGDLDADDDSADDDHSDHGDFDDAFDGDGFTRDDGVDGPGGNESRSPGVQSRRPDSIEEQEREEER